MRSLHQLLLVAALVATTSAALAQERGQRGPGGRGGSPSGAMLLGQKSVQEDLKLSEEQVKQVEEFTAKQREGFSGLRDASREERTKRFNESREAGQKVVDSILNDEQRTRLKQISLQLAGPASFADPAVTEKLAFSDDQKKSIEAIQSGHREEVRSMMQDADGDRAEAFRKMQAARQATEEKLKGLLTDEQKTKWEELLGKKFEGRLEGPGGRGFGRGRRGNQDASLRREADTTVLTADKSDEGKAEKQDAEKKPGDTEKTAKRSGDSKQKHAKYGKQRDRGDHAARHHARGPHARHASHRGPRDAHAQHGHHAHHRHAHHRHGHHGRGPEHGFAHRGTHRQPQARFAHHGYRPQFGGQFHGRHFAHRGPHSRHHFGPGQHFGAGFDARRQAWNRVALAMGAHHGPRSFSHAGTRHFGPRHHGPRPPHHFAHRGHGERHRHQVGPPHFAQHHGRVPAHQFHGQKFHGPHFAGPHRAWRHHSSHRAEFAAHHRGPRHGHGEGHGRDEHRLSGFGGPRPPHFAWHIERHREGGPNLGREHGENRPPRIHPAGFKKRHHDAGDEGRGKGGDQEKRHAKRPDRKSDKQKNPTDRDGDQSRDRGRDQDRDKDSNKYDQQDD